MRYEIGKYIEERKGGDFRISGDQNLSAIDLMNVMEVPKIGKRPLMLAPVAYERFEDSDGNVSFEFNGDWSSSDPRDFKFTGTYGIIANHADGSENMLGTCSEGYELVDPYAIAEMWQDIVGNPIQARTIGPENRYVWLAAPLPSINVGPHDDNIQMYLNFLSPYTGNEGFQLNVFGIRGRCTNGLVNYKWAHSATISHGIGAMARLGQWLSSLWGHYNQNIGVVEQKYNTFYNTKVTPEQELKFFAWVYPRPSLKPEFQSDSGFEKYRQSAFLSAADAVEAVPESEAGLLAVSYNNRLSTAIERQRIAMRLYQKTGRGSSLVHGTAFGLINAVSEIETHRLSRGLEHSILVGERSRIINRAMEAAEELVVVNA